MVLRMMYDGSAVDFSEPHINWLNITKENNLIQFSFNDVYELFPSSSECSHIFWCARGSLCMCVCLWEKPLKRDVWVVKMEWGGWLGGRQKDIKFSRTFSQKMIIGTWSEMLCLDNNCRDINVDGRILKCHIDLIQSICMDIRAFIYILKGDSYMILFIIFFSKKHSPLS